MGAEPELDSRTAQPRLLPNGGGIGDDPKASEPTAFHAPRGPEVT
jgi:hypothetical protein